MLEIFNLGGIQWESLKCCIDATGLGHHCDVQIDTKCGAQRREIV